MFSLRKFETACEETSFQETRDLAWSVANPDICFNVSKCVILDGVIDVSLLRGAIAEVAARHQSLRTTFLELGPMKFRRLIHERVDIPLEVLDKSTISAADTSVSHAVRSFIEKRFEIEAPVLAGVMLIRLDGDKTLMAIRAAHVISDAASLDVFFDDLSRAYQALSLGICNSLEPLDFHLSDFVQSHRAWMESDDCKGKLEAIRKKLCSRGGDAETEVGSFGVGQQIARKAAIQGGTFSADILLRFERVVSRYKVTPAVALLAAVALTFSSLMNRRMLHFSFMLSNRHYAGLGSIIGHIANAVPVFVDFRHADVATFMAEMNKTFFISASGAGIIPLGIVNQAAVGLDPVMSVKSPFNQLMVNISGVSSQSFAGMPVVAYKNPYAGFISNAIQLNISYRDGEIFHRCRCPEEDVAALGTQSAQALRDAVTFLDGDGGAQVVDFATLAATPG